MIRWNKTVTYRDDIKIKNIAEGPFKYKRKNRGIFDVGKALTKKKLKQCCHHELNSCKHEAFPVSLMYFNQERIDFADKGTCSCCRIHCLNCAMHIHLNKNINYDYKK